MNLRLTLLLLSLCALTSCAIVDPEYAALASRAETNPRPDAIVGMWHWKHESPGGLNKRWLSELFRPDHTGVRNWYAPDTVTGVMTTEITANSVWMYEGNGVWKVTYTRNGIPTVARFQMADGNLLVKQGGLSMVYKRVRP